MTDPNLIPTDDKLPDEEPDLSEIDPFDEDPSEYEDINEFVEADWSESTTARERVKDVIIRATSPQSATVVADLADVSPLTARDELNKLADEGTVLAESTDNGHVYQRDPDWYRIKRIRELSEKPQRALETTLRELEEKIEGYKDAHGVDDPEELILSDESLDDEEWEDISHWRTASVDREYVRIVLQYASLAESEAVIFDDDSEDKELNSA